MTRKTWHILREDDALTMARTLPVRFDLGVTTHLPGGDRLRIAQQVRQDVWRALRDLRGFAPVVRVADCAGGLEVTAGGQVNGAIPRKSAEARIAEVLENPSNRARWQRWAS